MSSRIIIIGLASAIVVMGIVLGAVLVDSDELEPGTLEARALNVDIRDGSIVQGDLEVREGEIVTLKVTTDKPWLLHLHSIEVADEVKPGRTLLLPFEADLTGRFEVELHALSAAAAGQEEGEDHEMKDMEDEGPHDVLAGYIDVLPR